MALGSLMSSGEELIDALFGGPRTISLGETAFGLIAAAAVTLFILRQKSSLVLTLVSPEIGRTAGVNVARLNLLFLEAFALTVALGLRYLGVLLMGSLIIIPAATAKRLSRTLNGMVVASVAVAVSATVVGTLVADLLHRPTGPVIISVAAGLFVVSLAIKRLIMTADGPVNVIEQGTLVLFANALGVTKDRLEAVARSMHGA